MPSDSQSPAGANCPAMSCCRRGHGSAGRGSAAPERVSLAAPPPAMLFAGRFRHAIAPSSGPMQRTASISIENPAGATAQCVPSQPMENRNTTSPPLSPEISSRPSANRVAPPRPATRRIRRSPAERGRSFPASRARRGYRFLRGRRRLRNRRSRHVRADPAPASNIRSGETNGPGPPCPRGCCRCHAAE